MTYPLPPTPGADSARLDYLSAELHAGNLAVFVGSGLSVGAGLSSWAELVRPLAEDLGLTLGEHSDLLAIAQYHCNQAGGNRFRLNNLIKTEFGRLPGATPAHEALAQLPLRTIWTTNYDRLIEEALAAARKHVDVKFDEKQIPARDHRAAVTLFKMHGDAGSPETATLTKEDYETYPFRHGQFLNFLHAELAQKTFLFIGFGFRDYNIDQVFGRLRAVFAQHQRRHCCALKRPDRRADEDDAAFAERSRLHDCFLKDLLRLGVDAFEIDSFDDLTRLLVEVRARWVVRDVESDGPESVAAEAQPIASSGDSGQELVTALVLPCAGTVYTTSRKSPEEPADPLVSPGSAVRAGDTLFHLRTYKNHVSVTSPIDGELVELLVRDNTLVARGQTLCFIRRGAEPSTKLVLQRAEMEGVFFRSPQPDFPPYVRDGDTVRRGDYLCIISVQKQHHYITASVPGVVRAINLANGASVVKGDYLVAIEASRADAAMDTLRFTSLPFRVQSAPGRGRFSTSASDSRPAPIKIRGETVAIGDILARIRRPGADLDVLSEQAGKFLDYMKRDGESVELGEPIIKLVPEEALQTARHRFRVQTADRDGHFVPLVALDQFLRRQQPIGTIDGVDILARHDGFALEVRPAGTVRVNDLLMKLAV